MLHTHAHTHTHTCSFTHTHSNTHRHASFSKKIFKTIEQGFSLSSVLWFFKTLSMSTFQLGTHNLCGATYEDTMLVLQSIKRGRSEQFTASLSTFEFADNESIVERDSDELTLVVRDAQDRFMALPANLRDAFFVR